MLNILLLSIFQSVFAITLPENEKLTCDEKEGQLQFIEQSPAAIDDDVWRNIELSTRKYDSEMSPQYEQQRKKGLILPKKKGIFTFSCIYDPAYSRGTHRIVTREKGATKILPRKD